MRDNSTNTGTAGKLFRWLAATMFALAVATIAVAGLGAFDAINKAGDGPVSKKMIEHGYGVHIALGSATVLVMIALPIVAAVGRLGTTKLRWSLALAALGIIQAILGSGETVPVLGLLHGLGAVATLALSGGLARRAWANTGPREPSMA